MKIALALFLVAAATSAHATTLQAGDRLTIKAPAEGSVDAYGFPVSFSGLSYWGFDNNDDGSIRLTELLPLNEGDKGLTLGKTTVAGANHGGQIEPGDTNEITAPGEFFANTGSFFLASPASGSTEGGLDLSGWSWGWNGIERIALGQNAWQPSNCGNLGTCDHTFVDGQAWFRWDGVYGHAYTLDYSATVRPGDPSGFGNVRFYLHLEGSVMPVPEPSPGWLFAAALPLIGFAANRSRKSRA